MAKSLSSEDSALADSSTEDIPTICPMCGSMVPDGANECPKCGEPFTPEAFENVIEKEEKGSKWLFWTGVIMVLIGGPGVALGSWLHDLLNISIAGYDNFESFGWANRLVSIVGIIILVVGIILLILSLPKLKNDDIDVEETGGKGSTVDKGG